MQSQDANDYWSMVYNDVFEKSQLPCIAETEPDMKIDDKKQKTKLKTVMKKKKEVL